MSRLSADAVADPVDPVDPSRFERWQQNALATDSVAVVDGDTPGPLVERIRSQAAVPPNRFRRLMGTLIATLVVAQAGTAALKSTSKTTRAVVSGPLSLAAGVAGVLIAIIFLGRYVRIGRRRYRVIAGISALLLGFIILTGSAVRLTGSGLGCPDWPTCKQGRIVPQSGTHAQIEFGNRIVTGLCVFAAAIGVLTALVRVPYRRDLVRLGLITSLLIFANAILGGLTVIYGLKPQFVMSHFLVAIGSLATGVLIFHRSGEPGGSRDLFGRDRTLALDPLTSRLVQVLTLGALVTLFLGTVVTGSGPHGGDPKVTRYNFSMLDVTRIHSGAVWLTLGLAAFLAARCARIPGPTALVLRKRLTVLIGVSIVQGAIGFIQYFDRLPVGLVQIHVLGATLFWVCVLWVRAATWGPTADTTAEQTDPAAGFRSTVPQSG
jgi:heme a synthase